MSNVNELVGINSDTILNSIADGVVVMGLDRKIIFVNRAAKDLLKKAGVDGLGIGQRCNKAIGHSSCSLSCLVNTAMKTGNHIYEHEVTLGGEGNKISLSVNAALLRDERGNVIGGIEIFRDISLINELKGELVYKYSFDNIVGKNHRMHEIYKLLHEVSPTLATVLIEGESGTGKELISIAIHHNSSRRSGPFIKLNCAALSDNLLESELFGHVKGAFTGAVADRKGRLRNLLKVSSKSPRLFPANLFYRFQ
ncbi:MAG: sigma 54-interacting transcriptional regulator [bacterium]|nr:sigma 54-interacting transcriptional regulator [bacterium]